MYNNRRSEDALRVTYDERLREAIIDIFACLIPKQEDMQDFKSDAAYRYFTELQKILFLDEVQGDIWLIYYAFTRLSEIKVFDQNFEFLLDKRSFSKSLESNINDMIMNNKEAFIPFLDENGMSSDLDIQKSLEDASDFLYSMALETFDEAQSMDMDVNDTLKYLDILKEILLTMLSRESLIAGSEIISGDGRYIGRRFYKGNKDFVDYLKVAPSLVSARFNDYLRTKRNSISLMDLQSYKAFEADNTTKVQRLFEIGWEPLDDVFSICTGDLITLIGDEGIGKTNTAIHILMQNIKEGHDVLMMTGESSITKIVNMCISNYIYYKTGLQFTWKEILNYTEESEEDQRLIELWRSDFLENSGIGRLHLEQSFNYEDFDTRIKEYLVQYPNISLVVIDHTDRLGSTGDLTDDGYLRDKKSKVDHLYKKEIELKQDYNIAFLNLAHSSSDAEKASAKGKNLGVRIGATSSATTKDADFVFYMSRDQSLNDGFIKWSCKKIRDYQDDIKPFVLKRIFEVSELEYDVDYQLAAIEDDELELEDMY